MPEKRKLPIESLSKDGIDDRWTDTKLAAEGFDYRGDGPCKTCGEPVSFYKRERATDYKGPAKWLILDAVTLERHVCRGRR